MTGTSRATPVLLWSRALLLGVVVLVVSSLGHVSADGLLPGPLALTVLLLLATLGSARFLTRQASTTRLVVVLVGGQTVIHAALSALAGHGEDRGSDHGTGHATDHQAVASSFVFDGRREHRSGSYFDQVTTMQQAAEAEPMATAAGPGASSDGFGWLAHLVDHLAAQSPVMVLAHLAVVVVLGVWLAVGERALWTLLTLTTTGAFRLVTCLATLVLRLCRSVGLLLERVRRTPCLATTGRDAVPLPHLLRHVVAHRGPPALLAS